MAQACYRLRTYDQNPPNGYPYAQRWPGHGAKEFPAQPDITAQARIVADWRSGNGQPRATVAEALNDIDRYQCFRLGNMLQWCVSCDSTTQGVVALNASSPIIAPCKGCGTPIPTT